MAIDEASQEADKHHEDHEWEAQRANFTRYYKDQNMTLKAATQCMITNHNFHATPRQWERKIANWGLQKYTSRQARLEQIAAQGRTVHEVASASRRHRVYDDRLLPPSDLPGDQRNIRRFARRELSRSRSRSRSNSFGRRSRASSITSGLDYGQDEEVIDDQTFNINFEALESTDQNEISIPAVRTTQDSDSPQAHVIQTRNIGTGALNTEVVLAIPDELETFTDTQSFAPTNMSSQHFGYQNMDSQFVPNQMASHGNLMNQSDPFPALDTLNASFDTFGTQPDGSAMQDMIADTTSFLPQLSGTGWESQPGFGEQPAANLPMFHQNQINDDTQNFNRTSTTSVPQHRYSLDLTNFGPPTVPVPEILLPDTEDDDFSGTSNLSQSQLTPAITLTMDDTIYADFNADVTKFTQTIFEKVMRHASSVADPQQLSNELQTEHNVFVYNLNMTLTNFAHTQQRALQSMRDKCKNLKSKNEFLQQQMRGFTSMPEQSPLPSPSQSPSGHRFSLPSSYLYNTGRNVTYS